MNSLLKKDMLYLFYCIFSFLNKNNLQIFITQLNITTNLSYSLCKHIKISLKTVYFSLTYWLNLWVHVLKSSITRVMRGGGISPKRQRKLGKNGSRYDVKGICRSGKQDTLQLLMQQTRKSPTLSQQSGERGQGKTKHFVSWDLDMVQVWGKPVTSQRWRYSWWTKTRGIYWKCI